MGEGYTSGSALTAKEIEESVVVICIAATLSRAEKITVHDWISSELSRVSRSRAPGHRLRNSLYSLKFDSRLTKKVLSFV